MKRDHYVLILDIEKVTFTDPPTGVRERGVDKQRSTEEVMRVVIRGETAAEISRKAKQILDIELNSKADKTNG